MTTAARHPLVEDYLKRLWSEAARLPVDQARELVADIDEHLLAALPHDASEAEVRNVLERLGSPQELVTAAGASVQPPPEASKSFASPGGAIACLVVGEILGPLIIVSIPVWIVGLVMMVRATEWSDRDRNLGLLVLGTGFPVAVVLWLSSIFAMRGCSSVYENGRLVSDSCGGTDWVAVIFWTLTLAYLALQAFTIWRLLRSARRS